VDVSEATFRDVFLPPFIAGIEAGALTLMSAFVAIVGGIPVRRDQLLQCSPPGWLAVHARPFNLGLSSADPAMTACWLVPACRQLAAAGCRRRCYDKSSASLALSSPTMRLTLS
jgi:hypothetical protein